MGLVSTLGHRDTLEMAKEIRYDLYDLFIESPPSLVPRFLRESVAERISPDGEILLEFDEGGFKNSLRKLVQEENTLARTVGKLFLEDMVIRKEEKIINVFLLPKAEGKEKQ